MRKIKTIAILLLMTILFLPINSIRAEQKIKVYMFRGEGCPHCEEALEFFDALSKRDKYNYMYDLVKYEVWNNEDNAKLMEKVAKELGEEASGVPYIVIGKKTFSGYSSEYDSQIKEAIKNAYNSDDYEDVVKKVKKANKKTEEKIPVVGISITVGTALLIIIGLVALTKKL